MTVEQLKQFVNRRVRVFLTPLALLRGVGVEMLILGIEATGLVNAKAQIQDNKDQQPPNPFTRERPRFRTAHVVFEVRDVLALEPLVSETDN